MHPLPLNCSERMCGYEGWTIDSYYWRGKLGYRMTDGMSGFEFPSLAILALLSLIFWSACIHSVVSYDVHIDSFGQHVELLGIVCRGIWPTLAMRPAPLNCYNGIYG